MSTREIFFWLVVAVFVGLFAEWVAPAQHAVCPDIILQPFTSCEMSVLSNK